jgi:uncharacterized membrane protein YccC
MVYLLILFVLAIILSPLLSLRQSPRQKQITLLRQCATRKGLRVTLSRPLGAREGEGRMDTAVYRLPWAVDSVGSTIRRAEQWQLVHNNGKGSESVWGEWRWLTLPPGEELFPAISQLLEPAEALSQKISGLEACAKGVAVYWQEEGSEQDVNDIAEALTCLRDEIRPSKKH